MRFLHFIGELRSEPGHPVKYFDDWAGKISGFVEDLDLFDAADTETVGEIVVLAQDIVEQFFL